MFSIIFLSYFHKTIIKSIVLGEAMIHLRNAMYRMVSLEIKLSILYIYNLFD